MSFIRLFLKLITNIKLFSCGLKKNRPNACDSFVTWNSPGISAVLPEVVGYRWGRLIFVWSQEVCRRTDGRVGQRAVHPLFSQVVFGYWLGGEGSRLDVDMWPRQRHVGMREGELCKQMPATGFLWCFCSLSELGPRMLSGEHILVTSGLQCYCRAAQGVTVQFGDNRTHVPILSTSPGGWNRFTQSQLPGGPVLPREGAFSPACPIMPS